MQAENEAAGMIMSQTALLMIEGTKMLVTLTGKGAVRFAALLTALIREQHKTRGAARLSTLLRTGESLEIYTIPKDQLKAWRDAAKDYNILYTVVQDKTSSDGMLDLFVRREDAPRINRMVERHGIGLVLQAEAGAEPAPELTLEPEAAAPSPELQVADETNTDWLIDQIMAPPEPEITQPDGPVEDTEQIIDQVMEPPSTEGLDELLQEPVQPVILEEQEPDPTKALTGPPSGTPSETKPSVGESSKRPSPPSADRQGTDRDDPAKRPSVREMIAKIKANLKAAKEAALSSPEMDPGLTPAENTQPEK